MSRIGKMPVSIPDKVKVNIEGQLIKVEGPKGKLELRVDNCINLKLEESQIKVERHLNSKKAKSLHGLYRALIFNMVKGVTEGFRKELEVVGVGYKVQSKGETLELRVGYSNPVEYLSPEGIQITTPEPQKITVEGFDKAQVGLVAAQIRSIRPPEPYKGKGIKYKDETIRRKVGKAITK